MRIGEIGSSSLRLNDAPTYSINASQLSIHEPKSAAPKSPSRQSLWLAARVLIIRACRFEVERGFAEARGEPVQKDFGLAALARPAGAVEHRQRHRERVVLSGAVARDLEMPVKPVNQPDARARGLLVFEAELVGEEL